ncbi:MAG: hypothetical protein ACRC5F_09115, partial [Cetobacterium sp.]
IKGDTTASNFKTSRTIILTYFRHNNNLRDSFYKNKRNTLTDEEVKKYFDEELKEAFKFKPDLNKYIKYEFINDNSSFHILFYFYSEKLKKIILDYNVDV